jgi:hypothetical protein
VAASTRCLKTSRRSSEERGTTCAVWRAACWALPSAGIGTPISGPSVGRLSGRNNAQPRDTTLTNDKQCALISANLKAVIRKPVWSPRRSCRSPTTLPSPGGQTSGIASPLNCCGVDQIDRVWHPIGLPQGRYHAPAQGQSRTGRSSPVEGCPRAGAWSGYARPTGCHTLPASKIVNDQDEQ